MLEKILMDVCAQMSAAINKDQMDTLRNVLFVNFKGKEIVEDKNEIIVGGRDDDEEKIKLFAASKSIGGRKKSTIRQYVNEIRACHALINKRFENITTMDLRWYFGILQQRKGNKISTIKSKMRYLNSFFTFLVKEEMLDKNPLSKIEPPKTDHIIRKAFSVEEIEAIRKACSLVRDRALVEFLYATGLRVSEVAGLKVGDIDMYRKEFTVIGKGNKERVVYISESAYYHLNEYFRWRQDAEGATRDELADRPLFVAMKKPYKGISKKGIEYLCKKIGEKAKVENVHPHRFRRTFATNMLKREMKIEELATLMGHSKLDTTMLYCNIDQENVKNSYRKCA